MNVEIERRFLVSDSEGWLWLTGWPVPSTKLVIRQNYLLSATPNVTERIRETLGETPGTVRWTHTTKCPLATDVTGMLEDEVSITHNEYMSLLRQRADPDCASIFKTRLVFEWAGRTFELDLYTGRLSPLSILEVELPAIDAPLELPPFLPPLIEVTHDRKWSNASLARHGRPT